MGMGAAALILGSDLRVGTTARMGPGFVPHAIGWMLIALGAVIALKGFARDAERVVRLHLRSVSLIVLSVVVFALLLQLNHKLNALRLVADNEQERRPWHIANGQLLALAV
jgi:Tripartite tricarboxylate transporter TctB family